MTDPRNRQQDESSQGQDGPPVLLRETLQDLDLSDREFEDIRGGQSWANPSGCVYWSDGGQ